jgi:hypothetical protein
MPIRAAVLSLMLLAAPPEAEPHGDTQLQFPALQVTLARPQADDGPMFECATLGGRKLCEEELGEAWCRKNGYAGGFDRWSTAAWREDEDCKRDDRPCRVVTTITCKGVPIMD